MTADIGFNPQNQQPLNQPVQQSEQQQRTQRALERLSSEVQPQQNQLPQPRDEAQLSPEALKRQSEAAQAAQAPGGQIAGTMLSEIQSSLESVERNVRVLRDLSQEAAEIRTAETRVVENRSAETKAGEQRVAVAQQEADRRLRDIDTTGAQVEERTRQLRAGPQPITGRLELRPDTENLGRLAVEPGRSLTLADLASDRPASLRDNPALAGRIAGQALRDVSVMRNTVENYQGSVSETSSRSIRETEQMLTPESYRQIMERVRENFSSLNPSALYEAAAAGISGDRAVELLSG